MILSVRYMGSRKIYAIKAVRSVLGVGLKESKTIVEAGLFLVSREQWLAMVYVYMQGPNLADGRTGFVRTPVDWDVTERPPDMPDYSWVPLNTGKIFGLPFTRDMDNAAEYAVLDYDANYGKED